MQGTSPSLAYLFLSRHFSQRQNHANLPTKYHFESPPIGEGAFRLFPSGTNEGYASGCEVFNSYGRRPNDNLMMEYGFGTTLQKQWLFSTTQSYSPNPLEVEAFSLVSVTFNFP